VASSLTAVCSDYKLLLTTLSWHNLDLLRTCLGIHISAEREIIRICFETAWKQLIRGEANYPKSIFVLMIATGKEIGRQVNMCKSALHSCAVMIITGIQRSEIYVSKMNKPRLRTCDHFPTFPG